MSGGNPPSFYRSFERFWEALSVLLFLIGILALLIAPNLDFNAVDGQSLLFLSIVCVLQAIYFDRKAQQAEVRKP